MDATSAGEGERTPWKKNLANFDQLATSASFTGRLFLCPLAATPVPSIPSLPLRSLFLLIHNSVCATHTVFNNAEARLLRLPRLC